MTTITYNGIELAQKKGGTVEVFCDRPSIVSIPELIQTLILLTQTEEEVATSFYSPQLRNTPLEESSHRPEPEATQ